MPRKAREKSPESVYHIMCRSESEFLLFRDEEDKDYYLGLLKRYTELYKCSLYAYCLMDNHLHLHLDPKGFDISKFMHSLNTAYVRYYNKKYQRHGHVFQERFQSKILSTDEYNLAVSAYIHNNPQDIEGYAGREEAYKYSSYGIYLGIRQDICNLIDKSLMMGLFNIDDEKTFAQRYCEFVSRQRDAGSLAQLKKKLLGERKNEYIPGRKIILREYTSVKVLSYISDKMMIWGRGGIATKAKRKLLEYRAFSAYVLRVLCGLGYKEICSSMYNITISGCARLCSRGYELISKENKFEKLFNELVCCKI